MGAVAGAGDRRGRGGGGGFTLIEVMVVVMIIGILLAVGVPTFLGARERAQDARARDDLRAAVVAAEAHLDEHGTLVAPAAPGVDAHLRTSPGAVALQLAVRSASGRCYAASVHDDGNVHHYRLVGGWRSGCEALRADPENLATHPDRIVPGW